MKAANKKGKTVKTNHLLAAALLALAGLAFSPLARGDTLYVTNFNC